ncbi:hypothetical protein A5789_21990 [Nocardia sp. 852002-51101_SCH5132738]|uniref:hypothetical protein n=1 Tax=Nocardia sp. 852002-51101_SCH5132738 TaxID=1834095 RepID=UPI0007E99DCE|nr:hypothetical protein [Nocardia sp. 852002-51101_SCH5132738]OBA54433.1 hypothetical protein A5789_21990 [Nocardia sp. 852002-51101_SCH5132738]
MSNNKRNYDCSTAKSLLQGGGMLAGTGVFALVRTGHFHPEVVAGWVDPVLSMAPTLAFAVFGALAAIGVFLLVLRGGRAALRTWWAYRRRWAPVMVEYGLTTKVNGTLKAPRLQRITSDDAIDVLTVRMLPGQTVTDWHGKAAQLASAFGAVDGRVSFGVDPARDVDLMLLRGGNRVGARELTAGNRPPLALPSTPIGRPTTARLSGFALRIGMARLVVTDHHGIDHTVWGWWARGRWGVREWRPIPA